MDFNINETTFIRLGDFYFRLSTNEETANAYIQWRQELPIIRYRHLERYFQAHHTLSIDVTMSLDHGIIGIQRIVTDIIHMLRMDIGVPVNASGDFSFFITRRSRLDETDYAMVRRREDSVSIPFDTLLDLYQIVNIDDYLERLLEEGYEEIEITDIGYHFEFPLLNGILNPLGGGCCAPGQSANISQPYHVRTDVMVANQKVHLFDYDRWSVSAKQTFGKRNSKKLPPSLHSIRGLYLYGWQDGWLPLCGIMSLTYGITYAIYRNCQVNSDDYHRARETLISYESYPNILYEHARVLIEDKPFLQDKPELNHADLCLLMDELGFSDSYTLVIVDASQRVLFKYGYETRSEHCEVFNRPFDPSKGRVLSVPLIEGALKRRIGLFYDHTYRHFLPIFSWDLFYRDISKQGTPFGRQLRKIQKRGVDDDELPDIDPLLDDDALSESDIDVEPTVNVERTRYDTRITFGTEKPVSKVGPRMYHCLYCDSSIRLTKVTLASRVTDSVRMHACRYLSCDMCHERFAYITQLQEHRNAVTPAKRRQYLKCGGCHTECYSEDCLRKHSAVCRNHYSTKCDYCHQSMNLAEHHKHTCLPYYCGACKTKRTDPLVFNKNVGLYSRGLHPCYIPRKGDTMSHNDWEIFAINDNSFFAFDFESMLHSFEGLTFPLHLPEHDTVTPRYPIFVHKVNCAAYRQLDLQYACLGRPPRLEGDIVQGCVFSIDDFWTKVVLPLSKKSRVHWIAHNFKGYDGRLLYSYLLDKGVIPRSILWQGSKLVHLVVEHPYLKDVQIHFKDSLCHLPTSLAALPAMFGLGDILKKGYFPYLFNTQQHQDYRGIVPHPSYFDPDHMKPTDRRAFFLWHAEQVELTRNGGYDFKRVMVEYCQNDVLVLARGLEEYCKVGKSFSNCWPLSFITLAQFTYTMYLKRYLPPNTICYLDQNENDFARRALHGGNTNVRRFYYHCDVDAAKCGRKGLRYVDVQSLYPTVQFYYDMPTGRPTISYFVEYAAEGDVERVLRPQPSRDYLMHFFGFIECDIRPAKYLHHPLLPHYDDKAKRLLMPLKPLKRVVLTSAEFQEAVREGDYICTRVYRIDEYQKSRTLFKDFIRTWLRLKILSSKCPIDLNDAVAFDEYAAKLKQRVDIDVSREDFASGPNPSLRTLAKLILNSLWGKFGQREDMVSTGILKNAYDVYKYTGMKNAGFIDERRREVLPSMEEIVYYVRHKTRNTKNVAVASFVTAHARILLWQQLRLLGERVVYHDTDSIIYESHPTQYAIPEGKFLGDWESETKDVMIHDFVSLAPKTYAYRYTIDDKMFEVVKVKGFRLNYHTATVLNYESLLDLLVSNFAKYTRDGVAFPQFPELQQRLDLIMARSNIKAHATQFAYDSDTRATMTYGQDRLLSFQYKKGMYHKFTMTTYPTGTLIYRPDLQTYLIEDV
jgi:hypothetical protein